MVSFDIKKYWHRWNGETVVCMASGPSMTKEDAEYCNGKARVITVNTTYKLAPWADIHYSSDHDWWNIHLPEVRSSCSGELWTGHHEPISPDMHYCPYHKPIKGISNKPGIISWGGNSGFCAVGLAVQFGAGKIIMLGYDMINTPDKEHWHGQHEEPIRKGFNFPKWIYHFSCAYNDFVKLGIEVVNCSRETALPLYRRAELKDVLK
jgi:hypothetical protein